jgi:hypothetical protein
MKLTNFVRLEVNCSPVTPVPWLVRSIRCCGDMPSRPDAEPFGNEARAASTSLTVAWRQAEGSDGGSTKIGLEGPGGCLDCKAAMVSGVSGAKVSLENNKRVAPLRSPSCIFSSTFPNKSYFFLWFSDEGAQMGIDGFKTLFLIFCVSEILLFESSGTWRILNEKVRRSCQELLSLFLTQLFIATANASETVDRAPRGIRFIIKVDCLSWPRRVWRGVSRVGVGAGVCGEDGTEVIRT